MPKASQEQHRLACTHEAAHAVMFHVMGFNVVKAVALMPDERVRRELGETVYYLEPSDDPLEIERLAIGICAGYVAELLFYYGIEGFDGEDVLQLCNRDNGYEIGYACHICDFCIGDDAFEDVIIKTKRLLQTPNINNSVYDLAAVLHRYGTADRSLILAVTRYNGLKISVN